MTIKVASLLAIAAAVSRLPRVNDAYAQRQEDQRKEHLKAVEKKKRIREEIRARKAALKGDV